MAISPEAQFLLSYKELIEEVVDAFVIGFDIVNYFDVIAVGLKENNRSSISNSYIQAVMTGRDLLISKSPIRPSYSA